MEQISRNIRFYRDSLPKGVDLVAVSKFHPIEAIQIAYNEGQRIFGESRANELVSKAIALPDDIKWHFIGHLQTNKVRQILPYVSLIHSIDSDRLLYTIEAEAKRINHTIDILLQLHVAQEETKFGFTPEELIDFVSSNALETLKYTKIRGVMGMASNTNDDSRIKADFNAINNTYTRLKELPILNNDKFSIISMGMSEDYELAIEYGSNMVRIGSSIFGNREY